VPRTLPPYQALPISDEAPPGSAWGVFGVDDQLGTVNLLTPERVRRAVGLVRKGTVFPLNWDLEKPNPPLLGRRALRHTIARLPDGTDDHYDSFFPQASSQWDSLSHICHPTYGFYNGCQPDEITGREGSRNGIDNVARHGIVGRFILADIERFRARHGGAIHFDQRDVVSVDEVEATLAEQRTALEEGDVLLLHFGWVAWYERSSATVRDALSKTLPTMPAAPGLARGERTAAWLWDRGVAVLAADVPTVEAMPFDITDPEGFLHYRLISLLGMTLGELLVLDALADDCEEDGTYEGLFAAAPLNKVGGSGSPANALAIK
jgi:kynurenine formamidase